jgi:LytTr DNA-binding domain
MQILSSVALQPHGSLAVRSGIRVAIMGRDAEMRRRLRTIVEEDASFVLVNIADSWAECERGLDEYLPELLIANAEAVPPQAFSRFSPCGFPVGLWLGTALRASCGLVLEGLEDNQVRRALLQASTVIHRRMADELSMFLGHYLEGTSKDPNYVNVIKIHEAEGPFEIPIETILVVAACGNYIRVHTARKTYDIRETMMGISEKLDPTSFVRVHRSYIVNLMYVCELVQKEGVPSCLVLNNGMELPVGPNYRNEVNNLGGKLRLTA